MVRKHPFISKIQPLKKLSPLVVPAVLLIISSLLWTKTPSLTESKLTVIRYFSHAILLTSLALSYWFNRGRVFFTLTVLFLVQALSEAVLAGSAPGIYYETAYPLAAYMVPINIIVFSRWEERGILSPAGKKHLGFIAVQLLIISVLCLTRNETLIQLLTLEVFPFQVFSTTPLPQLSIIVFTAALLILLWRQGLDASPYEIPFLGVLVSTAAALHHKTSPAATNIFFAAGGLMLIITVMQDLYRKAYLDELTGLPTRRALKEELLKLNSSYTIAILDVDFFKKFNDTYGHDVGDQVLKFTSTLIKNVGGGGRPFRYGGEEFIIVFPGKNIQESVPYLDQLRDQISRRIFILRSKDRPKNRPESVRPASGSPGRLSITVSIGVAGKGERHRTSDDVIRDADAALYRAKKKGRNCISK